MFAHGAHPTSGTAPPGIALGRRNELRHVRVRLVIHARKQGPQHLHGVFFALGEQTAQALPHLLGIRLRLSGQWPEQIGLDTEEILKLETYGQINVWLGAIDNFITR